MSDTYPQRFADKVALITGGAGSIGRATALRLAREGATITIVDINKTAANAVAKEVEECGVAALAIQADISTPEDNEMMVAATVNTFGHLDVLFNNAGVGGDGTPLTELSVEKWDGLMAVNLRGVFLGCKYGVAEMIKSGGGVVINMGSSTGGWDTIFGSGSYMASKEGIEGITKCLALEVAQYGIRVAAVCPGIIQTALSFAQQRTDPAQQQAFFDQFANRIPLRRVGQPEDIAAAVAFLASNDARHITGTTLLIDGGQTLQSWSNAPDAKTYPWQQSHHVAHIHP